MKKKVVLILILLILLFSSIMFMFLDNAFYIKYNVSKNNFIKINKKDLKSYLKDGNVIIYINNSKNNDKKFIEEINKLSKKNSIKVYFIDKNKVNNNIKDYKMLFIKNGKIIYKYKSGNFKKLEKNFKNFYPDVCTEKIGC